MSGRIAVLCAAAVVLLASAVPVSADPPDVLIIAKPRVFGSLSRATVRFPHAEHAALEGMSCLTCHHKGDPSTQCEACHETPAKLEKSFHQLCITCHEAQKKKGRVTGPRTCGECHAWER